VPFEELGHKLSKLLIVVHKQYGGPALGVDRSVRDAVLSEYHIIIHG
jgi:hypothetical protein